MRLSILAVGDTGQRHAINDETSGQAIVARNMAREDRLRPINALLLLGDNFYEEGLRVSTTVARLKENIVAPYCRFVDLQGPDSAQVAEACLLPPGKRHPIPIFAVLGNHDYYAPGSPKLEAEAIPRYVANWHMPEGPAEAFEVGHGVSLVLFDSEVLARGEHIETLRDALRDARGPWRILVGHRPLRKDLPDVAYTGAHADHYIESVARALSAAGVAVHVFLSGHEHNLQILEMDPPAPPLQVIAGSGSSARGIDDEDSRRLLAIEELGFVRLDLVEPGEGNAASLVVSAFEIDILARLASVPPRLAARWAVAANGRIRRMPITETPEARLHGRRNDRMRPRNNITGRLLAPGPE